MVFINFLQLSTNSYAAAEIRFFEYVKAKGIIPKHLQ